MVPHAIPSLIAGMAIAAAAGNIGNGDGDGDGDGDLFDLVGTYMSRFLREAAAMPIPVAGRKYL